MNDDKGRRLSRREILQGATAALGIGAAMAGCVGPRTVPDGLTLKNGDTILFQGDSITDVGRDRAREGEANQVDALGHGYPLLLAYELLRDHPRQSLAIYNRGVSGNTVPDLAARWQQDCVDLQPDVLSILIGVNDIWHKLDGEFDGTVQSYRNDFSALLAATREALPEVRIVICEPFALRTGAGSPVPLPTRRALAGSRSSRCSMRRSPGGCRRPTGPRMVCIRRWPGIR